MGRSTENAVNRYKIRFLSPESKFMIRKCTTFGMNLLASCFAYLFAPILPKSVTRLDRPIFVIGCSRSGTTIFVDMLREHKDIAESSEAGGIFEPRYFDPGIDHVKGGAHATKFESRRLQVLFGLYVKLRGKRRFINKHPQNSLRLEFIRAIFPDAKFVHLIREGGATAYSNFSQVMRDKYRQSIPFGSFPKPPEWRALLGLPQLLQYGYQWRDLIEYIRTSAAKCGLNDDYIEIR